MVSLTFDVILGIRIWALVVVDHLNHQQQIILIQLLQSLGQLVHVDLR